MPYSLTVSVAALLAPLGHDGAQQFLMLREVVAGQSGAAAPRLWPGYQWSLWILAGLVALLLALFLLVRSITNHVLGINLTDARAADESQELTAEDAKSWILLRPSQARLQAIEEQQTTVARDLRCLEQPDYFAAPAAGSTLLVKHLEAKLAQAHWRTALLAMLTAVPKGRLILSTEIDPLYYLTERVREQRERLAAVATDDKDRRRAEREQFDVLCRARRLGRRDAPRPQDPRGPHTAVRGSADEHGA